MLEEHPPGGCSDPALNPRKCSGTELGGSPVTWRISSSTHRLGQDASQHSWWPSSLVPFMLGLPGLFWLSSSKHLYLTVEMHIYPFAADFQQALHRWQLDSTGREGPGASLNLLKCPKASSLLFSAAVSACEAVLQPFSGGNHCQHMETMISGHLSICCSCWLLTLEPATSITDFLTTLK
ncbi:hypothetical protein AMECASPLE_031927 [Ameca splendens]|uniref:Uncharacterized protein n=1 Tax=Ameca splendens TaxID=208324 RepID=A0ABV0YTN2_9TELE